MIFKNENSKSFVCYNLQLLVPCFDQFCILYILERSCLLLILPKKWGNSRYISSAHWHNKKSEWICTEGHHQIETAKGEAQGSIIDDFGQ